MSLEFPIDLPRDIGMFRRPRWLVTETPAWVAHIPFAFWLTEIVRPGLFVELGTHYGNSYFAFCQAMAEGDIDVRAYAVDTWQGDEHSGGYGEEVFESVHAHNRDHYSRFSTLVRSTFDEASEHFEGGEIDLLHIDGHHTYESVKHDFDVWVPKLSDRSVVVLHDIGVRERDFGVHRLWDELASMYPAFGFDHGHGLGVVAIGAIQPDPITALCSLDAAGGVAAKSIFASLGRALLGESASRERIGSVRRELLERTEEEIGELHSQFEAERSRLESLIIEMKAGFDKEIDQMRDEHAREVAALKLAGALADQRAAAELDGRLNRRGLG